MVVRQISSSQMLKPMQASCMLEYRLWSSLTWLCVWCHGHLKAGGYALCIKMFEKSSRRNRPFGPVSFRSTYLDLLFIDIVGLAND